VWRDGSAEELASTIDPVIADMSFSGVVRIDRPGREPFERAAGFADRRWSIPMTTSTRLSTASGTKGFTALAVMRLVEQNVLALDTTARSLLGDDLPLIDDAVTIEDLLAHRSGIGDYLDEEKLGDISAHVMPVPVHQLDATESYLAVLGGFPQVFPPGTQFAYNNGGFVVLALLAERAARRPYHDLVDELVVAPAGLTDTGFIRSDALPEGVATGYLDRYGLRNNALHLPLVGVGDGGIFSTTADMARFWTALFAGDIVAPDTARLMTTPRSESPSDDRRYGLGFWLHRSDPTVILVGYDAGVSFSSQHDPATGATLTVISNTSEGTWDLMRATRGTIWS
jgi:CubicO group peptidase (beta-lactamase class C family)